MRIMRRKGRLPAEAGACHVIRGAYDAEEVPMKKIESIAEMTALAAELRAAGKTIGLVSTMGALHGGQEALIRAAKAKVDAVVVSIFVNPLQFGPNEVIAKYPRRLAEDLQVCEASAVFCAFVPTEEEMLPRG